MAIRITYVAVSILTTLLLNTCNAMEEYSSQSNLTMFNFTDPETFLFEDWIEVSDTFRVEGRSIAALVPHTAYNYQSAVFFYLLNPQPDGSGFAGIDYILDTWDLSKYTGVVIDLHRQGENSNFKLIFYGNCSELLTCQSYESFFEVINLCRHLENENKIELPFSTFAPYFRGEPKPDSPPLDLTQLSRFGIQVMAVSLHRESNLVQVPSTYSPFQHTSKVKCQLKQTELIGIIDNLICSAY
ncbi:uncharacterized protein DC041_0012915 [Schistosoma bovis]|uniref:NADH:ubiquinone oxidoreductase intermediate-associated protein 30 domain-containing protein n=1 Tax=Schistosoma bovis TaxID=6184 RepID=A0A430Q698_SCHBO|nr:uncharacterized protein DC041_0012915 [Schistosoma bovis]